MAVITGSANGMGKGMAQKFAGEGCDIVVADINLEGAKKVADTIKAAGRKAVAIQVDISNSAEIKALIEQSIKEFGKIDILVNNAGAAGGGSRNIRRRGMGQSPCTEPQRSIPVMQTAVPYMKKQGYGKIINISSMGAVRPSVSVMAYHAAKAGILGLTTNLAFELAPLNIYVNCIVPGPIETTFWYPWSKGMSADRERRFLLPLRKKRCRWKGSAGRKGSPGPHCFLPLGSILFNRTNPLCRGRTARHNLANDLHLFSSKVIATDSDEARLQVYNLQVTGCGSRKRWVGVGIGIEFCLEIFYPDSEADPD